MGDRLEPQSDREILLEIHHDVRELKDRLPVLERRVADNQRATEEKIKALDEKCELRLAGLEKWQFAMQWIGGPLWGLMLIIVGAAVTVIARLVWH